MLPKDDCSAYDLEMEDDLEGSLTTRDKGDILQSFFLSVFAPFNSVPVNIKLFKILKYS